MALKEYIKQVLKRIPIPLSKNHLYDIQTRKILKKVCREDSICIDVGCHRGEVLEWMIQYAPNAQHYAFEPIPEYVQYLKEKFGKICHIFPFALSDKSGATEFHFVQSNPSYSGIKKRRYDRANESVEIISVNMRPMDEIIPLDEVISFIKIDVEGAEYLVLQGAQKTILKSKPVVLFETGKGGLDHYGLSPDSLFDFMDGHLKYQIFLLGGWLKNNKALTKEEFLRQFNEGLNYYFVATSKTGSDS